MLYELRKASHLHVLMVPAVHKFSVVLLHVEVDYVSASGICVIPLLPLHIRGLRVNWPAYVWHLIFSRTLHAVIFLGACIHVCTHKPHTRTDEKNCRATELEGNLTFQEIFKSKLVF